MRKIVQSGLPGRGPATMAETVEEFLGHMAAEGKSPATIRAYGRDLKTFTAAYPGAPAGVTAADLSDHLRRLKESRGLAPATLARHRVSLRAFFAWAAARGLVPASPAAGLARVRLPDLQPRALPDEEVWRVLRAIKDPRDRLVFYLLAETGARVSEVLGVRLERIRLHAQELSVVGKGQRERTLYLAKTESALLLRRYLRAHGWLARDGETITERGLLFRPKESMRRAGKAGAPIDYTVIQRAWRRYCAAVGVTGTIHQLRHAYATRLINRGLPMEVVQKILGHRNLQTTQRYAEVSDETVRRALDRL